jgi:hypothetical protein
MKNNRPRFLSRSALAMLAAFFAAGSASAMPQAILPADGGDPSILQVQDICGTLGNCGIGRGGINTLPRHTIKPDIGRFDPGHDNRFGRYRYTPPDQQLNLGVQQLPVAPRPRAPRYTGTRTLYKVGKLSAEHVDWCYARYKSYRARDNTYQPKEGPRKVCVSPFS